MKRIALTLSTTNETNTLPEKGTMYCFAVKYRSVIVELILSRMLKVHIV